MPEGEAQDIGTGKRAPFSQTLTFRGSLSCLEMTALLVNAADWGCPSDWEGRVRYSMQVASSTCNVYGIQGRKHGKKGLGALEVSP